MPREDIALNGTDRGEKEPRIPRPRVAAGQTVDVTIRLKPQGWPPITDGLLAPADYPLSNPAYEPLARLIDFAKTAGLSVTEISLEQSLVKMSGPAAFVERAFRVTLDQRVGENGGSYHAHYGPVRIPAALSDVISGVFGLDSRPAAKSRYRQRATRVADASVPSGAFLPTQLAAAYNFPSYVHGWGQSVAIIELGGGYNQRDLTTYFSGLNLAAMPEVHAVLVDGAYNATGSDADGEVMLDIEIVGAVAPKAKVVVYFAPNTDRGFLDVLSAAVHDNHYRPSVISISWGSAESNWTPAAMVAMDKVFQEAAVRGITVLVASGDNGSSDGVNDGQNHVDFPASSPWVTACGGTTASYDGVNLVESVWNDSLGGAGGGGYSLQFARPSYQLGSNHEAGRGVPDICGNADPATGWVVRVNGQDTVIGGTSAVAPFYAGLAALINQIVGRNVGFWNQHLYATPSVCRDVTDGNNGTFFATSGYDVASGLGSVDGMKFLASLQNSSL